MKRFKSFKSNNIQNSSLRPYYTPSANNKITVDFDDDFNNRYNLFIRSYPDNSLTNGELSFRNEDFMANYPTLSSVDNNSLWIDFSTVKNDECVYHYDKKDIMNSILFQTAVITNCVFSAIHL